MPRLTTEAKRLRPLIFAAAEASQAAMAVRIIVYHRDGAPAEYFPVTDAGWDLAAAACRQYDTMVSPPAKYDQAHTVPNEVMYMGAGDLSTEHTAPLTMGAGCYLYNLQVKVSADDANDLAALYGPASGKSWTNTVNLVSQQYGAGNAYAFQGDSGTANLYDTYLKTETTGDGIAAAIIASSGDLMVWNCEVYGLALGVGEGYGIIDGTGEITMYGGLLYGSTYPAIKEGATIFSPSYSSIGIGKVLDLGVGGTPPSGWTDLSFDDSGWDASIAQSGVTWTKVAGTDWITAVSGAASNELDWLYRHEFNLPPGEIQDAVLEILADNEVKGVYINGDRVWDGKDWGDYSGGRTPDSLIISHESLLADDDNVIAIQCQNGTGSPPNPTSLSYKLTLLGSGVGPTEIKTSAVCMTPVVGEPMLGDKSVWDVNIYGVRHASDIANESWIYHKNPKEPDCSNWDIYNVKDYGAIGDGATDDTDAVQDALDAANLTGGIVYFPQGTYLCGNLTDYRRVLKVGAGMEASIIKATASGSLFTFFGNDAVRYGAGFRDLYLDGDSTGTNGIDLSGAWNFLIERVVVKNFTGAGIKLYGSLIGQIHSCALAGNAIGIKAERGILGGSFGSPSANLVKILDTRIVENPSYAVHWTGGAMLMMDGCDLEDNGTTSNAATGTIYFKTGPENHTLGLTLTNCWFEGPKGHSAIRIDAPEGTNLYHVIENSLFGGFGLVTYGLYVEGASKVNTVICRAITSDNASSSSGNFYANGTYATIYLENCYGTTGGSGTIVIASPHSPVTLGGGSDPALSLSGQELTLNLIGVKPLVSLAASEALTAGNLVNIWNDSGTAKARKADASGPYSADGFVLANVNLGETAIVYLGGIITDLSGLMPGAKQYLSTNGTRTEVAPTAKNYIMQEVGTALNTTSMIFEPQQTILLE